MTMATEFEITDESLASLRDKVVIVTGCSSGIGLATVQLLLSLGAKVVGGDIVKPPATLTPEEYPNFAFVKTDVSEWSDQVNLFKKALHHGQGTIDHVFANAGTRPRTNYVDRIEVDEATGDPIEPPSLVLDVNLKGSIHTATLAVHYMRPDQGGIGGSIVVNASTTAFTRFSAADYSIAKHGTIGLVRSLHTILASHPQRLPVRINGIAASWTSTSILDNSVFEAAGVYAQPCLAVARAAAFLMASGDGGKIVHVDHGVYKEVDEAILRTYREEIVHPDTKDEDKAYVKMRDIILAGMVTAPE
ncbi:short chain dehydrogenase [Xylariaceae sp. FL0594]|nr:short chain dehydrogenase [Xylariaceae sp. FL0594]